MPWDCFVSPGEQQPLIEYLYEAAQVARDVEGWISASLHRSLDGTRVVNYAQSVDREAAERAFDHLLQKGMIEGNRRYGDAHPGLYEVALAIEK